MSLRRIALAASLAGLQFTACIAWADENPALASVAQEEAAIRAAVEHVAESVVQIRTIGGLEEVDRTLLPDGPTTGLVISQDGWIVSSAFNFVQQPASILVTFASGEQAPAELVAKDHSRMLVLLKAQGVSGLAVPEIAPAKETRVGQWAVVVGRAFRPDRTNISVGIVSAVDRMLGKAIQTDANVSTANYGGPLIDIRGRVLGVVVPMAPQATSDVAGAEWYDSGIGFAVPLAEFAASLERMKQGKDQHAGVLGIGMAAENPHGSPAELATVLPTSPAGKAGLKKGDTIIEIDGRPIATQTDLRFALGTKYAGDNVRVKAKRGAETVDETMELVGELEPFRHAFLGMLPMRAEAAANDKMKIAGEPKEKAKDDPEAGGSDDPSGGVIVRWVYPGSPAAAARIRSSDRVVSIDGMKVNSAKTAIDAMNNVVVGTEVAVAILRDDKPLDLTLIAARLPTNLVSELPPASRTNATTTTKPVKGTAVAKQEISLDELKLAEFTETCRVYLPSSAKAGQATGLLIWLHAPGEPPTEELFREWQSICDRDGLILVVPTAADTSRWDRTELEYLRRLTERVLAEYPVDRRRVVVFGQEGGGAMAYLLALVSQDLFTGVATSAAALPRTIDPPSAQPTTRLAVFAGLPANDSRRAQTQNGLKKLADAGYPVTVTTVANQSGKLSAEEREQLARWLDSLDRF